MQIEPASFFTSIISAVGISAAGVYWLGKSLISHQLNKDLAKHKLEIQGEFRKEVEQYIGDQAAEREYQLEARKNLYKKIGPLRFQLLMACRDLANRVRKYPKRQNKNMSIETYYGVNTIYRILLPLTISELIEREIAFADFSVDPATIKLLTFRKACFRALLSTNHLFEIPSKGVDGKRFSLYHDNLRKAAHALVVRSHDGSTTSMTYHEFEEKFQSEQFRNLLEPFPGRINSFSIEQNPKFWVSLVGYGHICNYYINYFGKHIGFSDRSFNTKKLVKLAEIELPESDLGKYVELFDSMISKGL